MRVVKELAGAEGTALEAIVVLGVKNHGHARQNLGEGDPIRSLFKPGMDDGIPVSAAAATASRAI